MILSYAFSRAVIDTVAAVVWAGGDGSGTGVQDVGSVGCEGDEGKDIGAVRWWGGIVVYLFSGYYKSHGTAWARFGNTNMNRI